MSNKRIGRSSFESSSQSLSWRDDDDDINLLGSSSSSLSNDKLTRFDNLLRRIENEREKIAASPHHRPSTPRLETIATPTTRSPYGGNRGENNTTPSSISGGDYDFARRARELRMSDGGTPKSRSSVIQNRVSGENTNMNTTPRSAGGRTPIKRVTVMERGAGGGMESYTTTSPMRSPSPMRSSPNIRSSSSVSPMRSNPSPINNSSQNDFKLQVSKFHDSLVSAHDTITTLEKDIRMLKKQVKEKDNCIDALDTRNKSLNETVVKLQGDNHTLLLEKEDITKRHTHEIDKLQVAFNKYQQDAQDINKISEECKSKVNTIQSEKQQLESAVNEKDNMITSLRQEIQRLNEELADGAFVRAKATKAEEQVTQLQLEVNKLNENSTSTNKVIVDLELRLKEKSDEYTKTVTEKDEIIATLQSELESKASSERLKDKSNLLGSQLGEAEAENEHLSFKLKDMEKRLLSTESTVTKKNEEIEKLETTILDNESREKDLKRTLEKEQEELQKQRTRFEQYDTNCAKEQETISALEQAIEDLEAAHNASNSEIFQLQAEKESLSATLDEAEAYMKMYSKDMQESQELKSMMCELQDINAELGQQLQTKDDEIRRNLKLVADKEAAISKLQRELSLKQTSEETQDETTKKLEELTIAYEHNEAELEHLRSNKSKMIETVSKLEEAIKESSFGLGDVQEKERQLKKSQEEAKQAKARVDELEEVVKSLQYHLNEVEEQKGNTGDEDSKELKKEVEVLKAKLNERDEQLVNAKNSIAEAQKMIFRLMGTVQELRKKSKGQQGGDEERSKPTFTC